jgi:hypothetical protein
VCRVVLGCFVLMGARLCRYVLEAYSNRPPLSGLRLCGAG